MTKARSYRSIPKGGSVSGGIPSHQRPIVAIDADWVWWHGSRAQRRRLARAMQRQERRKG